jgi:hypothetical protein
VEALRTILFAAFLLIPSRFVLIAALTGRTIFPAKYNRTYVTAAAHPVWFAVSVAAWLLMGAILAYISFRCWQRFVMALRR